MSRRETIHLLLAIGVPMVVVAVVLGALSGGWIEAGVGLGSVVALILLIWGWFALLDRWFDR